MEDANVIAQMLLLAEDSSSDESDEYVDDDAVFRITIDIEQWRRLGDPTFKSHFRMDRYVFERLVVTVGRHMDATNRIRRKGTPVDVALMMTLWILATPDTFRSVGVKFGVNKTTVHFHYKYMIEVLHELIDTVVKWPSPYEQERMAIAFEERYGYPGVGGGCIDGCHIRVTAPLEQPQRYVNRHHDYSILLQGVCDNNLLFRDVYIGEPGSVGDSRTFKRSPLGQLLLRDPNVLGDDHHILGDGAYTCAEKMMVPFRDYGNLTLRERTHNHYLSRCRATIERAFALLKGKWRRLKYFPSYCLEYAIDHIFASVFLHNFIILEGEQYEGGRYEQNGELPPLDYAVLMERARVRGLQKREYIANLLLV